MASIYLVETSRICDPQAARAPFPPPAENALFGSIFDFLKNTPQADLSGFEVPPGAKGVCNGLNMARNVQNKYLKKIFFWVMR